MHAVCLNENCSAVLILYTENLQETMKIIVFGYDADVSHTEKRYLTGKIDKEKTESLLTIESAMVTRAKLANEYLFDENEYAAHLCSKNALKQRKYRMAIKSARDINSVIAVTLMKKEPEYVHTILDVGIDPLYVIFAVPLQKEFLLKSTCRKKVVLSIDATGISIKPTQFSSMSKCPSKRKYKKSFLYIVSLQSEFANVPIFQWISQRHSHEFIAYILQYFKYRILNDKMPHEFIMDDSSALLLACVLTFTRSKSVNEYLDECFDALFDDGVPPLCFIRLDRAHFVKAIKRLIVCDEKSKKKFYQRLLGYLMLCDDVNEAENIIRNMFILLKNEFLYDGRALQARDDLESIVKRHKHVIKENTYEDKDTHDDDKDRILSTKTKTKFALWIDKIAAKVDEHHVNHGLNNSREETNADRNPYVSKKLIKPLTKMLSRLSLFSNIMNETFHSTNSVPSSACTENQFKMLKSYIFSGLKGMCIYVFRSLKSIKFI